MNQFDAIIIGAGQAGPSLAGKLTGAGQTVAYIERKLFGGTCVNTGCMPTKTLVASAYAAHLVHRAADYGIVLEAARSKIDMRRVKARADTVSCNARTGVEKYLREMKGCTVFQGHARFEAPDTVSVGTELLDRLAHLHRCGRARHCARSARHWRRALPDQYLHACAGSSARASHSCGRRLCWPGVRADVPAFRRTSDHHRERAAPGRARRRRRFRRDPGDFAARGHHRTHRR